MNITSIVAESFNDCDITAIIEDNKEIQFYACGALIYWQDTRFRMSMDMRNNSIADSIEELYSIFTSHLDSLSKEFLEKTKDNLIAKYIGVFDKPNTYFQELNYLNIELTKL